VDFVISHKHHIIPIEVKSGSTGSLRSLKSFILQKKSPLGVRVSEHPLSFHEGVLSVPFYLIEKNPVFHRSGLDDVSMIAHPFTSTCLKGQLFKYCASSLFEGDIS
jgi:hypothetical protein